MELAMAIEEFSLHLKLARRSPYTRKQYIWNLGKFREYLEEQDITVVGQVTRHILRQWSVAASEKWAPATHRQAVNAVKGFFKFLVIDEVLESDPARTLLLPEVPKNTLRTLESQEVSQLLDTIQTFPSPRKEREMALVCLLTDSGLRASEVCHLCIDNLKLDQGTLLILGKGRKLASAPFGAFTAEQLRIWLATRSVWLKQRELPDPSTVFISLGGLKPGKPLTPDGLRRVFAYLGDDAGVSDLSPHVFRRTFATLLSENGAPTRITQIAGRWSGVKMVERYTRVLEDAKKLPDLYRPYSPIDNLEVGGRSNT